MLTWVRYDTPYLLSGCRKQGCDFGGIFWGGTPGYSICAARLSPLCTHPPCKQVHILIRRDRLLGKRAHKSTCMKCIIFQVQRSTEILPESFDRTQLTPSVLANDIASDKRLSGEQTQACARDARLLHLESLRARRMRKSNKEPGQEQEGGRG